VPAGSLLFSPSNAQLYLSERVHRGGEALPCWPLRHVHGHAATAVYARAQAAGAIDVVVGELWLVNHLGRESGAIGEERRRASERRFVFDAARAAREISACTAEPEALGEARAELLASGGATEDDALLRRRAGTSSGAQHSRQRTRGCHAWSRRSCAGRRGLPSMRCRYAGMRCCGCGEALGYGAWACAGGHGLAHDCTTCMEAAQRSLAARVGKPTAPPQGEPTPTASEDLAVGHKLAAYIGLEIEFALESDERMATCVLPRDRADVFQRFVRWATERGVERESMSALMRAGSTLMARTRGYDVTAGSE
jgi:hypothetical protein